MYSWTTYSIPRSGTLLCYITIMIFANHFIYLTSSRNSSTIFRTQIQCVFSCNTYLYPEAESHTIQ